MLRIYINEIQLEDFIHLGHCIQERIIVLLGWMAFWPLTTSEAAYMGTFLQDTLLKGSEAVAV